MDVCFRVRSNCRNRKLTPPCCRSLSHRPGPHSVPLRRTAIIHSRAKTATVSRPSCSTPISMKCLLLILSWLDESIHHARRAHPNCTNSGQVAQKTWDNAGTSLLDQFHQLTTNWQQRPPMRASFGPQIGFRLQPRSSGSLPMILSCGDAIKGVAMKHSYSHWHHRCSKCNTKPLPNWPQSIHNTNLNLSCHRKASTSNPH